MKTAIRFAILLAACGALLLSSTATALAQRENAPYVTLDAGVGFLQDVDVSNLQGPIQVDAGLGFGPGYRAGIAVGYRLRQGGFLRYDTAYTFFDLAVEFETGLAWNPLNQIDGQDIAGTGARFDFYQVPMLANVMFRIPFGEKFSSWLGGGLGGVMDIADARDTQGLHSTEADFIFAYQGIVRFGYAFSDQLSLDLSYKFLGSGGPEFTGDFQMQFDNTLHHSVGLALRWVF